MLLLRVYRATVVVEAAANVVATAAECAASCGGDAKCNAWMWCDDAAGCSAEFDAKTLPRGGCQLQTQKLAPAEPLFSWQPSRFSAGYNGGDAHAFRARCLLGLRLP